jgi:hypothetical protein
MPTTQPRSPHNRALPLEWRIESAHNLWAIQYLVGLGINLAGHGLSKELVSPRVKNFLSSQLLKNKETFPGF